MDVISAGNSKLEPLPGEDVDLRAGLDRPRFLPRDTTPWTRQFTVLFRRSLKEQWRKREVIGVLILQSVVIAVLIGTVFLQVICDALTFLS